MSFAVPNYFFKYVVSSKYLKSKFFEKVFSQ